VRSTDHKAFIMQSSPPLCYPVSQRPKYPSAPYSRTPSAYVPASVWRTNFNSDSEQQAKL